MYKKRLLASSFSKNTRAAGRREPRNVNLSDAQKSKTSVPVLTATTFPSTSSRLFPPLTATQSRFPSTSTWRSASSDVVASESASRVEKGELTESVNVYFHEVKEGPLANRMEIEEGAR